MIAKHGTTRRRPDGPIVLTSLPLCGAIRAVGGLMSCPSRRLTQRPAFLQEEAPRKPAWEVRGRPSHEFFIPALPPQGFKFGAESPTAHNMMSVILWYPFYNLELIWATLFDLSQRLSGSESA
jgi:hypothetical protein